MTEQCTMFEIFVGVVRFSSLCWEKLEIAILLTLTRGGIDTIYEWNLQINQGENNSAYNKIFDEKRAFAIIVNTCTAEKGATF